MVMVWLIRAEIIYCQKIKDYFFLELIGHNLERLDSFGANYTQQMKNITSFLIQILSFSQPFRIFESNVNPLSANSTKWSNTLKQSVRRLPTNCLSVFDHFMGLALKGLTNSNLKSEAELLKKKQQHKSGYCILRNCSHGKTQFAV